MFGQVQPTPYDIQFSLFGIPVRVHPFFWIIALMFSWPSGHLAGPVAVTIVLISTGCLFLSILIHELGHALTAKYFGWPPHIVLYHMGGYAAFHPTWGYTTTRAILTLLAGPGAGFLLYFATIGIERWLALGKIPVNPYLNLAFGMLEYINLWWGLVNLLPVFPLDGGQICRHLFTAVSPRKGLATSLQISILVSGATAIYFYMHRGQYGLTVTLLFGFLCYQSVQAYQQITGSGHSGNWR